MKRKMGNHHFPVTVKGEGATSGAIDPSKISSGKCPQRITNMASSLAVVLSAIKTGFKRCHLPVSHGHLQLHRMVMDLLEQSILIQRAVALHGDLGSWDHQGLSEAKKLPILHGDAVHPPSVLLPTWQSGPPGLTGKFALPSCRPHIPAAPCHSRDTCPIVCVHVVAPEGQHEGWHSSTPPISA